LGIVFMLGTDREGDGEREFPVKEVLEPLVPESISDVCYTSTQ
jgi:hypothetical protein